MESKRLVVDASVEIGPLLLDAWPLFGDHAPQEGIGHYVGGVTGSHQSGGESGQFVGMLPVDLGVSRLHNNTIPRPRLPGDTETELPILLGRGFHNAPVAACVPLPRLPDGLRQRNPDRDRVIQPSYRAHNPSTSGDRIPSSGNRDAVRHFVLAATTAAVMPKAMYPEQINISPRRRIRKLRLYPAKP